MHNYIVILVNKREREEIYEASRLYVYNSLYCQCFYVHVTYVLLINN